MYVQLPSVNESLLWYLMVLITAEIISVFISFYVNGECGKKEKDEYFDI